MQTKTYYKTNILISYKNYTFIYRKVLTDGLCLAMKPKRFKRLSFSEFSHWGSKETKAITWS